MDKHIEVGYGHHNIAKQKGKVLIKMCNDKVTLYNVLLASDICNRLFSNITLMNLGYTFLFKKGFYVEYFGNRKNNAVTLRHSAQRKHSFLG